jgi:localization factor PodJL
MQEAFQKHLAALERNMEHFGARLKETEQRSEFDGGVQEAFRGLSSRMDAAEKKSREALNELKASLADTSKHIKTIEMAMPLGESLPPAVASIGAPALSDFDASLRADGLSSSPRSDGTTAPDQDAHSASSLESFEGKEAVAAQPSSSSAGNYLAQARRAAQAAAESEGERRTKPRGRIAGAAEPNEGRRAKTSRRISRAVAMVATLLLLMAAGFFVTRNAVHSQEQASLQRENPLPQNNTAAAPVVPTTVASLPPAPAAAQSALPDGALPPAQAAAHTSVPTPNISAQPATSPSNVSATALTRLVAQANGGDVKAALALGMKYADGDGVPANDFEAVRWLQKAAESGEPVAQYRLGTLYEKGRGLKADPRQAIRWYGEAAKRGNRKAMHNLAVAYADGSGTTRNFSQAAHWFRAAAELGLTDSQFNLAVLYERGLGVQPSLSEAYKWYAIAAAAGDTESKARVEALANQIPAGDRDGADKTAKTYKAQPLNIAANDGP